MMKPTASWLPQQWLLWWENKSLPIAVAGAKNLIILLGWEKIRPRGLGRLTLDWSLYLADVTSHGVFLVMYV